MMPYLLALLVTLSTSLLQPSAATPAVKATTVTSAKKTTPAPSSTPKETAKTEEAKPVAQAKEETASIESSQPILLDEDDEDDDELEKLLLEDEEEDELDLKELEDDSPIEYKDSIPNVKNPTIQSAEERNAPDPDPGNTEGFPQDAGGFQEPEKIDPTLLEDDGSYTPPTPEQMAAKKKADEEERAKILANAEKKEAQKNAHAKKRDDIFSVNLKGLKEAGVDISKDGFGFTGKRYFWTDQYVRLTFALNLEGLLAQGLMNELNLGPLKVTGVGPDGQYGTDDDGVIVELRVDSKKQRFMASGMIDLLGAIARCDLIFGTGAFTFFTQLKLLKEFQTKFLAESRGKGKDLDFVLLAALNADILKLIEELGSKAVDMAADVTADGIKALRQELEKVKVVIKEMKKAQKKMGQEFMKNERAYKKKTKHAEKVIAPLRKTVRTIEKQVSKLKKQIWSLRRKFIRGREKSLSGLKKAVNKVNSLKNDVKKAKRTLQRAKRATKWYKPWTYAVVAAQAVLVAIVEASRWAAEKVLKGLMGLINLWPIDATPPLPALWAAYGSSVAALKSAHASLSAAMLASNPLAMKEMAAMISIGIAMAANQIAMIAVQHKMFMLKIKLIAYEAAVRTAGEAASAAVKAAAQGANALTPFNVTGGSVEFSLRDFVHGKLPTLKLNTKVFGARRNLSLSLDLTDPKTFALALPKMIADLVGGGSKNNDVMARIESTRLKYKDELDALDKAREKAEASKGAWQQKDESRKKEIKKIEQENIEREASVAAIDTMQKGSGEFGQKLDLKGITKEPNKEIDIFDEKNPRIYTAGNRFNQYRWTDKWQLPTPDSGSVVFYADADKDIQFGLHTQAGQNIKERTFDLIIGFYANKGTVIRNAKSEIVAYSRHPGACIKKAAPNTPQPYWTSYHKGFISCGFGKVPGKKTILEWQMPNPPPGVKFFSFSCHNNTIRFTDIMPQAAYEGPFGSRYSVFEGFNNFTWHPQLNLDHPDASTITFKAKAARDLVIGLTDNPSVKHARYLVSLGLEGNSLSSLTRVSEDGQKYNRIAMTKDREALVQGDGETFHDYWVTFDKGHFAVGIGSNPTKNIVIESLEDAPVKNIKHLSFSSWDNSIEIRDIKRLPTAPIPFGTTYSAVNRQLSYEWRDEWQTHAPGKTTITWLAKGDEDMAIGLHTHKDSNQKNKTFEILVGANNNTRTLLRDYAGKELTSTHDLDAVIQEKNNYTPYWLSYDNGGPGKLGYIALGAGSKPGKNIVLEYEGISEKITHFALSNNKNFVSYKKIKSTELVPVKRGKHFAAKRMKNRFHWRSEWQLPEAGEGIIVFKAQAKNDVTVGLHTTSKASPDDRTFDVIFGADNNSRSLIRDHTKKVLRADKRRVSRIGSDANMLSYWVWYSKKAGTISYGRGDDPSKNEILTYALDNAPAITHFSLSSGDNLVTYKDIAAYAAGTAKLVQRAQKASARGDTINLGPANGVYRWKEEWRLPRKDVGTVIFSARTQDAVHLGFHSDLNAPAGERSYEVTFNQHEVAIRNKHGKRMRSTSDKKSILQGGGDFFSYWVNYYKGQIVIGLGRVPGKNIIIEWQDRNPQRDINYFSLTSHKQSTRIRGITTTKATHYSVGKRHVAERKNGKFEWHDDWRFPEIDKGAVFFKAQAKRDIIIGLAQSKESGPTYIITLGAEGNTHTVINKGAVVARAQGAVASEKELREYWLAYDSGTISVGHGDKVGENTIITWFDALPKAVIQYASFTSGKVPVTYQDITIEELRKKAFNPTSFNATGTNKTFTYNNKWIIPGAGGTLTFRARGSENIRVGLQSEAGSSGKDAFYEVAIGAQRNTATIIKHKGETVAQTTKPTALLLDVESPQPFWITYKDNRISVGSGSNPTKNMLLSWQDENSHDEMKHFSFSAGKKPVSIANIKMIPYTKAGGETRYTSRSKQGKYKVVTKWRPKQDNSATVITEINAEHEAMIGFFENTMRKVPYYDLIIGGDNNSALILRKQGAEVARVPYSMESFLSKTYWFSHHHGVLTAGTGKKPGENQLIIWQDRTKASGLNFFGLSSGSNPVEYTNISHTSGVKRSRSKYIVASRRNGRMLWNNKWHIPVGKTVTIDAQAPHADIYLGLRADGDKEATYTIRLGGWRNSRCVLFKGKKEVASIDKKMNTTNVKRIWLTYAQENKKNRIIVGTGIPGDKVLLDWTDTEPTKTMTHLGLSSGKTVVTYSNRSVQDAVMPLSEQERAAQKEAEKKALEKKAEQMHAAEEEQLLSIDTAGLPDASSIAMTLPGTS